MQGITIKMEGYEEARQTVTILLDNGIAFKAVVSGQYFAIYQTNADADVIGKLLNTTIKGDIAIA